MTQPSDLLWKRNLAACLFGSFTTVFALTMMLPFLPLYVEQLGVHGDAAIMRWSGVAYSASFLSAAVATPVWGYLSDRYGRRVMLIRASLGMAVMTASLGFAATVWELVALRFFTGFAGGYSSGALILVAVQTPRERIAWSLGILSAGVMAGNLIGPLAGGFLPGLIGIRATFWAAGGLILIAFFTTVLFVHDSPSGVGRHIGKPPLRWANAPNRGFVLAMLLTAMLLTIANFSIEPIITIYMSQMVMNARLVPVMGGLALSATAFGSIISASKLGKLADTVGHTNVISGGLVAAALLLIPQAMVTTSWQLVILRFLMGIVLGGLLPCIASVVRLNVPEHMVGTILGYSLSCQFLGQISGPLLGGFVGAHFGVRSVFFSTSFLLGAGALLAVRAGKLIRQSVYTAEETGSDIPNVSGDIR